MRQFCLSETIKKPRLRGEYSISCISYGTCSGSSPLARGILVIFQRRRMLIRIIPACAGNTIACLYSRSPSRDHPRLRGEYQSPQHIRCVEIGSSPPARGIRKLNCSCNSCYRIIPACAGNTLLNHDHRQDLRDHPRLRGEYTKKSLIFFSLPFLL